MKRFPPTSSLLTTIGSMVLALPMLASGARRIKVPLFPNGVPNDPDHNPDHDCHGRDKKQARDDRNNRFHDVKPFLPRHCDNPHMRPVT
jgi:hypothetical protein